VAKDRDVDIIAKLYETEFPEHIMVDRGLLNNPDYIKDHIHNPDEVWVVAEKDGQIAGVAALCVVGPIGLGEIERVCTSKPHRGNGVAHSMCDYLLDEARGRKLGFVEAFARGDQPAMQRTFEKLGFRVYGVAPRFEIIHDGKVAREQFVHMGYELKPETVDEENMRLIPAARIVYDQVHKI
jgi:N-acetylglutamate synthase-like GNAT family acetyltransferase